MVVRCRVDGGPYDPSDSTAVKKVSIMGDSYSTYEGWSNRDVAGNPNDYYVYYPHEGNTDVTSVEKTWWHMLCQKPEFELEVSNAYSGSVVSNTHYNGVDVADTDLSFMHRVGKLAGLTILGSSVLMSCTNPKNTNPIKTDSDTTTVVNIKSAAESSFSDTTMVMYIGNDTNFPFLIDRGSQPYMTISINFKGGIMAYWGDEEHRICYFDRSIDELKQIILDRFESGDKPKENELFHVGFDVSTPKNLISALKTMLQEIGVHHCELSEIHNMLKLNESKTPPPPPHAIICSDITEDEIKVEEVTKEAETDEIFFTAEQLPEFPGGMAALMKYLQENIKYPAACKKEGIQGRVIVLFTVNKDGSISEANVLKPVHPQLDAEALRVVNAMPNWIPGKQKGERVRVRFTLPISFRLSE